MYDFAQSPSGVSSTLFFKTTTTAYSYDGVTVTQVTDVDYPATTCRGCAFLDGKFFVMTTTADIYQSATEDALTWSAVEFIGASIEPDTGVYLAKYQNYIVALKGWSTEFFYDATNPSGSILSPVPNMVFKIGCASAASVREMAGTLVWMGKSRDGEGREIYGLKGLAPERISSAQVEKILMADDLASVSSWSCKIGEHHLYGLTLGTLAVSIVYDFSSGKWSFFTYLATSGGTKTVTAVSALGVVTATAHGYSDGDIVKIAGTTTFDGFAVATDVTTNTFTIQTTGVAFSGSGTAQKYTEGVFPIAASASQGGIQWMQDSTSGALYTLTQTAYVDPIGAIAARIHTPKFSGADNEFKTMGSVVLLSDKLNTTALIRWSDDDYVTYKKTRPMDMLLDRTEVRRCGQYRRRSFELLHVENTAFRVEALEIDDA